VCVVSEQLTNLQQVHYSQLSSTMYEIQSQSTAGKSHSHGWKNCKYHVH